MRIHEFVQEHNTRLAPPAIGSVAPYDFQGTYTARLAETQAIFDELVDGRRSVSEGHELYTPRVFEPIDVGMHIVEGTVQLVIAQPLRAVLYQPTNRIGRAIELFALIGQQPPNLGRKYHAAFGDKSIGKATIDSSRRKAISSSVGKLDQFRELLDDVVPYAQGC